MMRRIWLLAGLVIGLALLAGTAAAQAGEPTDDEVNRVAKQLYCPVCENIPLDVCPTQACEQWRGIIRQKLGEGSTDAEIIQYFVDQYGPRVRAAPPASGFNWLAYIVPPVAILLGVFLLYRALRAWKAPAPEPAPSAGGSQNEYISRLEEELKQR